MVGVVSKPPLLHYEAKRLSLRDKHEDMVKSFLATSLRSQHITSALGSGLQFKSFWSRHQAFK